MSKALRTPGEVSRQRPARLTRRVVRGAFAAALVALIVGVYTARRATNPITELTSAADDMAAGQRDRRVTTVPNNK